MDYATATFSNSLATGNVTFHFLPNGGYDYIVDINVSNDFNSSACSSGLKWHIHEDPIDTSKGQLQCGGEITGNHYDPTLQCGSASQHIKTHCSNIGRNGSSYKCNSASYKAKPYQSCEVGDLSGKYGLLKANENNKLYIKGFDNYGDKHCNLVGKSIVFHCGKNR
eukprot:Pgem_evm1s13388